MKKLCWINCLFVMLAERYMAIHNRNVHSFQSGILITKSLDEFTLLFTLGIGIIVRISFILWFVTYLLFEINKLLSNIFVAIVSLFHVKLDLVIYSWIISFVFSFHGKSFFMFLIFQKYILKGDF